MGTQAQDTIERLAGELACDPRVDKVKVTGDRSVVRAFMPGTPKPEVFAEAKRIGLQYGVRATSTFAHDVEAGRSCWTIVARRYA